ncbi:NADPH-dependent FMN reductase [Enhygromyxa salina]|uniref:NADPH azoreductase n=1 Tax=Enhygromyxa salina TaxID=215803 RepID=A0A2S9Y833_9BACT|nr:NADPH-dependent FMN reductase [Enhygromyxa salina]PRQ01270.1 NADPH azoreductase [Enhygromyxa salina]
MIEILGFSGSLREKSFNSALLRAAAELAPEGLRVEIGTIRGIPLYDGDVEDTLGIPEPVRELKERIVANRGLLLVTPEYNQSLPGVMKNAIDWLSRPPSDMARVFGGRPVALMGATPGGFGTVSSQHAWLPVLRALGTRPWFGGTLRVAGAGAVFNANGELESETTRKQLRNFLEGFRSFVAELPGT